MCDTTTYDGGPTPACAAHMCCTRLVFTHFSQRTRKRSLLLLRVRCESGSTSAAAQHSAPFTGGEGGFSRREPTALTTSPEGAPWRLVRAALAAYAHEGPKNEDRSARTLREQRTSRYVQLDGASDSLAAFAAYAHRRCAYAAKAAREERHYYVGARRAPT